MRVCIINVEVEEVPEVKPCSSAMLHEYQVHPRRRTCSGLSLQWDRFHADSIECSGCSNWALTKPLHHAQKVEPGKCVVPQRLMTEGLYRTPCCNHVMIQAVLSGVISKDAPYAYVAQKGEQGLLRMLPLTVLHWNDLLSTQIRGYFRDHKGATVNKIQPCEFIE